METEGSRRRPQEVESVGEQLEAPVPWCVSAWASTKIAWGTTQIALSALLYLLDFASTLSTLGTYYYYNYRCPHHLASDPICLRLATNNDNYASAFIICLVLMLAAHLSNSLIFYLTLDKTLHPLRLAYFLPLIHLFNLLRLLWGSFTCKSLKDLYNSQQEATDLYNVLGASLDTIPQVILQFNIAIELLNYSASPEGTVPIPKILVFSIIASLLSSTFNGCTPILSLVSECTLFNRVYIAIIAGVQTLAVVVTKTTMVATLTIPYYGGLWITPYALFSMIFPWGFYFVLLQMHNNNNRKSIWLKLAQSLALAHVSVFIGPMYVIVRHFRRSPQFYSILVLGTLIQVMVEILGIVEMVIIARHLPLSGTPCRPKAWKSHNDNKFLTCHSVLGILCTTLSLIMLTSVIFIIIHQRDKFLVQGVNNEIFSSNSCELSNELDQEQ